MAFFDNIADAGVSGDAGTQQVSSLDLGILTAGTNYRAQYVFSSSFTSNITNTPEFMLAAIQGTPATAVPLPAAGWLLLAGLGGLAAERRRRKAA